jgi:hypothetical protein
VRNGTFMAVGAVMGAMALFSGCASECQKWQPVRTSRAGVPGPSPANIGNRVIYGQKAMLNDSWRVTVPAYVHIRPSPSTTGASDGDGFRVHWRPNWSAAGGDSTPTTAMARLVNEPYSDATGLSLDAAIALEESGAIMGWGWRPYVRVRRIVAGSDGTGIIMQTRPNRVVRVIVTDLALNKTARLWQYGATTPLFTFKNDGSVNHNDAYVDLLDNGTGSVTLLTPNPIAISTSSEAMSLRTTMVAFLK